MSTRDVFINFDIGISDINQRLIYLLIGRKYNYFKCYLLLNSDQLVSVIVSNLECINIKKLEKILDI